MSDDNKSPNSEDGKMSNAQGELGVILESAKAKNTAFLQFLETSTDAINGVVATAKTASAETVTYKDTALTAKGQLEAVQIEINGLVEKTKSASTEIDKLKSSATAAGGAIEQSKETATQQLAAVSQIKTDAEALKAAAEALSTKLETDHSSISVRILSLQEQQEALGKLLNDITKSKNAAEEDGATIKTLRGELESTKATFEALKNDTQGQHDALVNKQTELQGKISEIERSNSEISMFRKSLLEDVDGTKSTKSEILELQSQVRSTLQEIEGFRDSETAAFVEFKEQFESNTQGVSDGLKDKFDELYRTLNNQILALLPSAGAAGLASTYYDAKSRYSPTSFSGRYAQSVDGKIQKFFRRYLGYNPLSVVSTVFFYIMFLVPLLIIVYGTFELLRTAENDANFVLTYWMLGLRFLIALPLATISAFGFASLRTNRKLFEEYNHKQRVMELYQSFVNEIDTEGDDDLKKKLLAIMLDSVAAKAWDRVEGGDIKKEQLSPSQFEKMAELLGRFEKAFHGGGVSM